MGFAQHTSVSRRALNANEEIFASTSGCAERLRFHCRVVRPRGPRGAITDRVRSSSRRGSSIVRAHARETWCSVALARRRHDTLLHRELGRTRSHDGDVTERSRPRASESRHGRRRPCDDLVRTIAHGRNRVPRSRGGVPPCTTRAILVKGARPGFDGGCGVSSQRTCVSGAGSRSTTVDADEDGALNETEELGVGGAVGVVVVPHATNPSTSITRLTNGTVQRAFHHGALC